MRFYRGAAAAASSDRQPAHCFSIICMMGPIHHDLNYFLKIYKMTRNAKTISTILNLFINYRSIPLNVTGAK